MVARKSEAWAGMVAFAGTMLLVTGMFNLVEGLIVLFNDEHLVVFPDRFIFVDLTSWGWTLLLFGVALIAVGAGLLATQTWARISALIVVSVHAVWQVFALGAYPVWSLLMLALDSFIIFALTARWSAVQPDPVIGIEERQPSSAQRLSTH